MLKELAIFRHFFYLNRNDALELPQWEWESLISQYYALKAEDRMHQVYSVGLGFSGGEGLENYLKNLETLINITSVNLKDSKQDWRTAKGEDFRNLKTYSTEEDLKDLDKFLDGFL